MGQVFKDVAMVPRGLVLVTGPTGSCKSTTLAAMIDFINDNRYDHILTIEDPIEYVHASKRCLVNQRHAGRHTASFARALRGALREDPDVVDEKIRTMKTDPARARRSDPGDPANCPVFSLHEIYSDSDTCKWVVEGCSSAGIGCVDCKKPLIEAVNVEQDIIRKRAEEFEDDPDVVHSILQEGADRARDAARETLEDVRAAIGIGHR